METEDLLAIQDAHDVLAEAAQKLGDAIYKKGQGASGGQSSGSPSTSSSSAVQETPEIEEPDFLDENTFDD